MPEKRIATVSQINTYIKNILAATPVLQNIWIRGEISNFKHHYSGHMYLTLKDEGAVIKAVMFRNANSHLSFVPENGMKVLARGRISVFERDGQYQLYIEEMEEDGIGDLHTRFMQLKAKLEQEGLFDSSRKQPIPPYPKRIGVVTSATGAAVRDIMNILKRRYPVAEVLLYPVLVQGEDASEDIAQAITYFNQENAADVIIVGRGGGSIEDLWAFNEEATARAVAASHIPVISAVGHETDFTICDFVADLRAPTPSAAAELAVPDRMELLAFMKQFRIRLSKALSGKVQIEKQRLELVKRSPVFQRPTEPIDERRQRLDEQAEALLSLIKEQLTDAKETTKHTVTKLEALSPLHVLARGYSLSSKADGTAVRSVKDVKPGETVTVRVSDGSFHATVEEE